MKLELDKFGEVELINYIDLPREELLFVLKMRNHPHVIKSMHSKKEITEKEHFYFIESLKYTNVDKSFFLVKKNDVKIGIVNFTSIDSDRLSCAVGFFSNQFNVNPMSAFILENILIRYAFDFLKFNCIKAEVLLENVRVIQLHKYFGFECVDENESFSSLLLRV